MILSLVCSFSIFGESRDYQNYLRYFNVIGSGSELPIYRLQIGFKFLNQFIYRISNSFEFYLFTVALVSLIPKFLLIKKYSRRLYLSIITYILFIYPLHEINQIRIGLALGIFYLALHFYNFKKYLFSLILILLASSIHIFTLLLFVGTCSFNLLKVLKEGKTSKKAFLILIIGIISILLIFELGILNLNIGYYLIDTNNPGSLFSIRSILLLIITIIGLVYKRHLPEDIRNWHNLSLLGLISYYGLIFNMDLSHRIIQSTFFSYILWIEYLPKEARKLSRYILLFVGLTTCFHNFALI